MSDSTFKELPVISAGPDLHHPSSADPIIGIDLGTTNSLVAIVENGVPKVIPTLEGKNLVPSIVHFLPDGSLEVGFKAKKQRVLDAEKTVFSVKRLLGRGASDIKNLLAALPYNISESSEKNVQIKIGEHVYTPIDISALILKELKAAAEAYLGRSVEDAVITVPAYFNDSQRQATRAAGRIAGLNVLRILNEPTAAALAYGLQKKQRGLIAVYDLGGGTFDVSILKLRDGVFEVLATNGDTALGGDDIDQAVGTWIVGEVQNKFPALHLDSFEERAQVLEVAERLKIALSTANDASAVFQTASGDVPLKLDHKKLAALSEDLLQRTAVPVKNAMKDAGIAPSDLTDVVLVGGPTRLPFLRDFVENLFGRKPNSSVHPDEVVAAGAAIQADILAGNNQDMLLLDVVPLSLGIETFGGTMSQLIPRNTRIPTMAKEQFTTYVEGQTKVAINVFQGERELVKENRKLAEFVLHGIPPLPAGLARVEVTFLVDADGILSVSAKELYSGVEQSIEVKPTYGLSDAEVERMLEDGLTHAQDDASARQLIEAKNDAQVVLHAAEKSLPKVRQLMTASEISAVEKLMLDLKKSLEGSSVAEVKSAHKALNTGTTIMAKLLMSLSMEKDVKNTRASDLLKNKR